jgi:inorganic pyrophosphatase
MSFPKPFFRWRPHPWHGLDVGPNVPEVVHAYIEITPFDSMKYEIDKTTGYLRVDRPQHTSSRPPTLYGFIPRTYCGRRVNHLSPQSTRGDGDPMDICVISEQPITRGEVLLNARVVGGLQMVDDGEADDKIVAILQNDPVWGHVMDIAELPDVMYERLRHYFSTYKMKADMQPRATIELVYGREHAMKVIQASIDDYDEEFGG